MPKFKVHIREVVYYTLEVESDSTDTVEEDAEAAFVDSADLNDIFEFVEERDVVSFEEIK